MEHIEKLIKEQADAFVPPAPESYNKMVSETLKELRAGAVRRAADDEKTKRTGRSRSLWKPFAAAAAAVLALFVAAGALFYARPALAAELPGISDMVYAAAPTKNASKADEDRINALLEKVFCGMGMIYFEDDGADARNCFQGESLKNRENYLALAYIEYVKAFGDWLTENANADPLDITELRAERRAFRFKVNATLELKSRDGKRNVAEECTLHLWENTSGLYIERIEMLSDGYRAFVKTYEKEFAAVPENSASISIIPLDIYIMSYTRSISKTAGLRDKQAHLARMMSELEGLNASEREKAVRRELIKAEIEKTESEITPVMVTAEETAAELMYRYWLCQKNIDEGDFSDIMERNEQTDLFFIDVLVTKEAIEFGLIHPTMRVEKGSAYISEVIEENDETIKARFYVHTPISRMEDAEEFGGVGEDVVLTLKKTEEGYIVIGYDRDRDYCRHKNVLKPFADNYKKQGYSWQEAGQMLLEKAHKQHIEDLNLFVYDTDLTSEEYKLAWLRGAGQELMYQYWYHCWIGRGYDFSHIMERSEQTDLFIWDALLAAESTALGVLDSIDWVTYRTREVVELIEETDEFVKARVSVSTVTNKNHDYKEVELVLTAQKDGDDYRIVGVDNTNGDCLFIKELKRLAEGYMLQGSSWQEAGRLAYEKLHEKLLAEAQSSGGR